VPDFGIGSGTLRDLTYWQNGVNLFTHAKVLAGRPDAHLEALLETRWFSPAVMRGLSALRGSVRLTPRDAQCRYNMAEILFHRHQLRDALEQYQFALSLADSKDMALACLTNSGEILLDLPIMKPRRRAWQQRCRSTQQQCCPAITSAGVGSNANYEGTSP